MHAHYPSPYAHLRIHGAAVHAQRHFLPRASDGHATGVGGHRALIGLSLGRYESGGNLFHSMARRGLAWSRFVSATQTSSHGYSPDYSVPITLARRAHHRLSRRLL